MKTQSEQWNQSVDLREFDEDFARAESRPPSAEGMYSDVPDGVYDTQVEDVVLGRTSSTGNPMIVWKLRIQGPQCQGRTLSKSRVITPKTIAFVKEDLERLEIQLDRLSDLNHRLDEMIDKTIRVFKKTNQERRWVDVFFLRARKGPESEGTVESAWSTGTNDDLPF
ncbi:MAG: hypothetical protein HY821_05100 [Acidobacteria bacterium]|nr:hypothetical protein [Acidobacteriota bacterium]